MTADLRCSLRTCTWTGGFRSDVLAHERTHPELVAAYQAKIEAAANLLAEKLAAAPAAAARAITDDWPDDVIDVVRDALLLADSQPLSFTGTAIYVLDALAAAGYSVTPPAPVVDLLEQCEASLAAARATLGQESSDA